MDKAEILEKLKGYRQRLQSDVVAAYERRGSSFGRERFSAWQTQLSRFLDQNLPGASSRLSTSLAPPQVMVITSESVSDTFMRHYGERAFAFLDSLAIGVEHDEFEAVRPEVEPSSRKELPMVNESVFIVHGHNDLVKTQVARFVEKLGFKAIILHEQASRGMTVIEKIEANSDVGFAIVLYTGDDLGRSGASNRTDADIKPRARQNVVFEHGYLIAKLSRSRVVPLVTQGIELPSDISGVVYVDDTNWAVDIAKEMKAAGYDVDFNKVVS